MRTYRILLVVLALFALITATTLILYFFVTNIQYIYEEKLRIPLFTGLLTIAGFLLTLKTFIVVHIKKELYDSDEYLDLIASMRRQNPKIELYAPIARLAELLLLAVIMALTTSFLQITLGFYGSSFVAAVCVSFGITTLILIAFAWWQIRANVRDLFTSWKSISEPKIQQRLANRHHGRTSADSHEEES